MRGGLVAAVAIALACAASASAGTGKLAASVVIESQAIPGPNDPGRCVAVAFAQFPNVTGATGYAVHVTGSKGSHDVSGGGPPFPYDTYSEYPAKFTAPGGSHWFPLGSSSVGTGCADAEAGLAGRFAIASATVTVPDRPTTTTTKKEEKKATLSVAIQVEGRLSPGDTADGRITVRAGEQPVHGIRFSGGALRAAGKAVAIVDAPEAPGAFSLPAGGSRSFPFTVKGVAKGTATVGSAAHGTGPDGDPVSGAGSAAVTVVESALQVTLQTVPATLDLAVDDAGKVHPGMVSVEVRLKNTTRKPIGRVSLTALYPEPADEGSTPDQLAFDRKLLPVAVGTIAPGATFRKAFPLAVTSDGEYHVRAVAQFADSATSRTQAASGTGGRFELAVPPLWFEARVEQPRPLVEAGTTVLITGKLRNLSAVKTLCLAPLRARGTGNAGGTGPVDIASYGPDAIAPPVAGTMKPHDEILVGLWVKTAVDGGTRATIELDPKAGTIDPDGPPCLATKPLASPLAPKQIRVKPGSTRFDLHIDVRDPVFTATTGQVFAEYYGGLMYGAAKGSADFFGATFAGVAEMLSPASLLSTLPPVAVVRMWVQTMRTAELLAHYWENATPEQKQTLYSRVAAVFDRAVGDPWREARANVDGVVAPWLNLLVGAYYRGDYRTVARTLGEGQGYVGSQVTLNIAAAEIGNRLLEELPRLQAAFKEVGDTTRTFRTLRELPPGKLLNLRELKNLYGIAAEDLKQMAAIAERYGVRIGVKGRSAEAIAELKRGSVWKPEPVKPKNVDQIDRDWLGFKTRKGVVATKKFTAGEVKAIRERIASANLSFEQKQAIIERLGIRLGEEKYLPELHRYAERGEIDVGKNYRDNGLSAEDAPFESELRKFGLDPVKGSPGELQPRMAKAGSDVLAAITGDIDGLYIIAARGNALTAAQHLEILRELWKTGWQHPETLTWILEGEFEFAKKSEILAAHELGGEAAMEIGPDGVARAVFIDLGKSLLFDPRAFWLDVVGGFSAW